MTRKCSIDDWASRWPSPATTPCDPPGIVRVTSVNGVNAVVGVKVSTSPLVDQVPGVVGDRLGIGELVAGGEENVTVTGAPPGTPTAPAVGLTEATVKAGDVAAEVLEEGCRGEPPDVRGGAAG